MIYGTWVAVDWERKRIVMEGHKGMLYGMFTSAVKKRYGKDHPYQIESCTMVTQNHPEMVDEWRKGE